MAGIVKKCPCLRPKIEEEVRVLDYRHSSLHDVPSEVFNRERTLEELYADSNQIRDLPRELFYCHGLRKLCISDNEITSIPPAISSLANLEELDFSKNGIIEVPENIKGCKYLRSIDASVNPLGKLPEGFTQLPNLTHLFLNDTFLDYLPGSFGRMVKLRILELRENHLKTLPRSFSRLAELERLDIGNNEFTELTDVIGGLTNLLELWCDNNQITTITHSIGNLKNLMFLDASKNQLQDLPGEIEGCVSLADLHLTSNKLRALPDSIGNLNNLTTLKVDDNELTSLPKTLGGLASLSELNVSANDLEDLPASIGLLRNLRTFYADENFLQFIPAEMGSCSGITVLSLRSNKLTYIPDELGRIPRLRVLNLSDNLLRYLPFTIVKLKELQALWLTENQTRPLIPLQSEYEAGTGRKILTCYLLPQGELEGNDERDPTGDTESFHASMWDEERLRRQQIHFAFADDSDEEGTLVRCPTPYPKEMREKVRHARNLAMRQLINVTDGAGTGEGGVVGGVDVMDASRHSGIMDENGQQGFGYSRVPDHSDVRVREARITKPTSPTLQETHRLYRYDKEKLMKDKARMQHRLSMPDFDSDVNVLLKESRGKDKRGKSSDSMARRSGSVPDLPNAEGKDAPSAGAVGASSSLTYDDLYYKHIVYRHKGRRSRRMREYDSDTGYRSDRELIRFRREGRDDSSRGANSEILSVRSQPLPHHHYHHHNGRRNGAGYASDLESYNGGSMFPTANAAAAAFQQKHSQLGQHPAQSMPYNLNTAAQSPAATPQSSRQVRPHSPSKSEPRQYGHRPHSDYMSHYRRTSNPMDSNKAGSDVQSSYIRTANPNVTVDSNSTVSADELYKQMPGNEYYPASHSRNNSSDRTNLNGPYSSSQSSAGPQQTVQMGLASHVQLNSGPVLQNPGGPGPPLQNQATPGPQNSYSQGPSPAVARKPPQNGMGGSNLSLQHPPHPATPSPPVFRKDSFVDQSTPVTTQAPHSLAGSSANPSAGMDRRGGNLYTVLEERSGSQKHLPSQPSSLGQPAATPPPYNPAPPYRKPSDSGSTGPRADRLSSDSSSSRIDSPRNSSNLPGPMVPSSPGSNAGVPSLNLNRSQSSPCGFHGNNPYSDLLSTPREKLSFSNYADIDRVSQGHYHGSDLGRGRDMGGYRDNQTSRSGSSSSHIGSASQIGPVFPPGGGARRRDRSDSSDSRSDVHNHSSSRESPHSGSLYGSARPSSRQERGFDPYSGAFDTGNYEDFTMIPNQEQSSQVSSSTDSGYGHGHHVYERIGDYSKTRGEGYSLRGGPSSHSSGATSTPPSQRQTPVKNTINPPSRDMTPIKDYMKQKPVQDFTSEEHKDQFRITIKKNPGLGFSIAGGINSHGNPFRINDTGIFVTKVIQDGPASKLLRPGDKILEVNNVDFQEIEHKSAVAVLKTNNSVTLLIERIQKVNMV